MKSFQILYKDIIIQYYTIDLCQPKEPQPSFSPVLLYNTKVLFPLYNFLDFYPHPEYAKNTAEKTFQNNCLYNKNYLNSCPKLPNLYIAV